MAKYCCPSMEMAIQIDLDDERQVVRDDLNGFYGLPHRKEEGVYTPICFCPWCGSRIPSLHLPAKPYPDNGISN